MFYTRTHTHTPLRTHQAREEYEQWRDSLGTDKSGDKSVAFDQEYRHAVKVRGCACACAVCVCVEGILSLIE
jgi:hypothetical protein